MVENEGTGVGSCVTENAKKRLKAGEEEEEVLDRLSALPDLLIQHILCLLPATDLVKTCVLSKWWKNQWTQVPVLEFVPDVDWTADQFSNFIDQTLILHNSPNIHKFKINIRFPSHEDFSNLDSWFRFAVSKDVKELIVNFNNDCILRYLLPQFIFNNSSFVKLNLSSFDLISAGEVNWGSLKSLNLYDCPLENVGIQNILSGSPMLDYFELSYCEVFGYWGTVNLVIVSKSLKTLVLDGIGSHCKDIEISCPNLDRLIVSNLVSFTSLKIKNLSSSVYATLDFYFEMEELDDNMSDDDCINLVQQTLRQVQHVEKLEIGRWMMEILSNSKEDGDCICGLPDSFINRIISFLPSTKDAFKTDYYKTYLRRWIDFRILSFVPNEKFVIHSGHIPLVYLDPRLSLWIRFAAKKDIKELILECDDCANVKKKYPFPQFLFNNSSLVKLEICACDFMSNGNVNWKSLKSLRLSSSSLGNQAIENVLSGSPLLECLELDCCSMEGAIVVASEHLKTFSLVEFDKNCHLLEISCPNLESLKIMRYLDSTALKLMNLPSSLHATLEFYILNSDDTSSDDCMDLIMENMKPILHVEEREFKLTRLWI